MSGFVQTSLRDQVAGIRINRPELHNAFNDELISELTAAFESAGNAPDARVIVLSSEGKSFCAGGDLNWMRDMVKFSREENLADAARLARLFRAVRESPKPVIARVHGAAFGGGVGLVAACDMAVALSGAKFALSEVKLGILPAAIAPFLMEKSGPGPLRRYALTAEQFDAAEAKRIGLVAEVAASEEEMDALIARWCDALKKNSPAALAACKNLLDRVAGWSWDDLQALTGKAIADIRVSAEGQEGLNAFLEKRPPRWTVQP